MIIFSSRKRGYAMIFQTIRQYDFSRAASSTGACFDRDFFFVFYGRPAELNGVLMEQPETGFAVRVTDKSGEPKNRLRQLNYGSYIAADGSCRVLEAELRVAGDDEPYCVGFPLELAGAPECEHEFAVMFDGVRLQILCDGVVMDRDFPWGMPYASGDKPADYRLISPAIRNCRSGNDLSGIAVSEKMVQRDTSIQFYTPFGFNTWLGDVVVIRYRERFHLFYLQDRRHHGSRHNRGAHEFWHLSSRDLRDWVDHGPVFELDAQWQTTGTGNAFIWNDKLHLSFGWHTARHVPCFQTAKHLFFRNLAETGRTGEFRYGDLGDLLPIGAGYAVSEDGIHFQRTDHLIHYLENPSVFVQPGGRLQMIQLGVWESDHLGDWRLVRRDFPPSGKASFARNCLDCPAMFELAGWEYLAVGFTAFFGRRKGDAEWRDFVREGIDPYDGSSVPMYTTWLDGRVIEGGWLGGMGWGSCLLLREMVALGNGKVGKKWVAESLPVFGEKQEFTGKTVIAPQGDTLFEFQLDPADGPFEIIFAGRGNSCKFRLDPAAKRASWTSEDCPEVPTFREQASTAGSEDRFLDFPHTAYKSRNYVKENLSGLDRPFSLRILVHADPKLDMPVLDAEIAGCHTMAAVRTDLTILTAETAGSGFRSEHLL